MQIPEWIEIEIESAHLLSGSLPHDLLQSLKHVVVKDCDSNFEGQGTSQKFDEWVRSWSRIMDGKLVRTIYDIYRFSDNVTPRTIVEAGTEFIWDDSTIEQDIDGELVTVAEDNVELVDG